MEKIKETQIETIVTGVEKREPDQIVPVKDGGGLAYVKTKEGWRIAWRDYLVSPKIKKTRREIEEVLKRERFIIERMVSAVITEQILKERME